MINLTVLRKAMRKQGMEKFNTTLNFAALARASGVPNATLHKIATKKAGYNPTASTVQRLAKALGVTETELLKR